MIKNTLHITFNITSSFKSTCNKHHPFLHTQNPPFETRILFTKHPTVFPTIIKSNSAFCLIAHRTIHLSINRTPSDCRAEKRSYPYFRVPSDETQMKYHRPEEQNLRTLGLGRVYPFRATPPPRS